MCIRDLRNLTGGSRRGFPPHNANSMICILTHLFRCSLSRHTSLCPLFYLLPFLSLLYFLYDGTAWRGPRRISFIHEHRRFATDHCPPDWTAPRRRGAPFARRTALGLPRLA